MSELADMNKTKTFTSVSSSENIDVNEFKLIEIKNKKIITIGKCSKFNLYILGSLLFKLFSLFLLGFQKNDIGLFGFVPILYSYRSMQSIYTYLSYILFGIIFRFCSKDKKKDEKNFMTETLTIVYNKIMNLNSSKTNLFTF